MKVLNQVFAFAALAMLAGCGGGSNTNTAAQTGSCQAGYVSTTSYGCLPQGSCGVGQALYNNQCVSTGTTTGYNGTGYNNGYNNGYNGVTCTEGQLMSAVGNTCMPRGNCQVGFGVLNNTCQQGAPTGACTAGLGYNQAFGCLSQGGCPTGQGMSPAGCVTTTNTNNGYNNGGYNNGMNNCGPGSYNTVYGCLSQGPCMSGQVLYNNQCFYLIQQGGRGWNSNMGGGFGFQIRFGM